MKPKPKIKSETLVAKIYPLLQDAVDAGVAYGYRRAFKHDPKPSEEVIQEQIAEAVMNELMERFDIPEHES